MKRKEKQINMKRKEKQSSKNWDNKISLGLCLNFYYFVNWIWIKIWVFGWWKREDVEKIWVFDW